MKTFQIENYRNGKILATVTVDKNGNWSGSTKFANSLIAHAKRNTNGDHDQMVKFFSNWTNQILSSRLLSEE